MGKAILLPHRLNEYLFETRKLFLYLLGYALNGCGYLPCFEVGFEYGVQLQHYLFGGEVNIVLLLDLQYRFISFGQGKYFADQFATGGLAHQQALALAYQYVGDSYEDGADEHGSSPVVMRVLKVAPQENAEEGDNKPQHIADVAQQHDEDGGIFALPHRYPETIAIATLLVEGPQGTYHRYSGEHESYCQYSIVPAGAAIELRPPEAEQPLVKGDAATHGKDDERYNKRPEIELPAIAKGPGFVGPLTADTHAPDEQELADSVYYRMDTLGQHRGAARECRRYEFGRCNAYIHYQRYVNKRP